MNQKIAIFAGLIGRWPRGLRAGRGPVRPAYPAARSRPAALRSRRPGTLGRARAGEPSGAAWPAYVLQAVNKGGKEVRVVVDARTARIVRVVNLGPARTAAAPDVPALPPPYARPPAGIAAADGYGPNSRTAGLEPEIDPAAPYGPIAGNGALPVAPGRAPVANAAPAQHRYADPAAAAQAGGGRTGRLAKRGTCECVIGAGVCARRRQARGSVGRAAGTGLRRARIALAARPARLRQAMRANESAPESGALPPVDWLT